jgi:hypothetical protein
MAIPRDLTHATNPRRVKGFGSFGPPKLPMMQPGQYKCQLGFKGQPTDVVQLAVFNYRLR